MLLPVKHTFIHFQEKPSARCSSAPPEIFVELALASEQVAHVADRVECHWMFIAEYAAAGSKCLGEVGHCFVELALIIKQGTHVAD